jgi:hypothetical protein
VFHELSSKKFEVFMQKGSEYRRMWSFYDFWFLVFSDLEFSSMIKRFPINESKQFSDEWGNKLKFKNSYFSCWTYDNKLRETEMKVCFAETVFSSSFVFHSLSDNCCPKRKKKDSGLTIMWTKSTCFTFFQMLKSFQFKLLFISFHC